MHSVIKSADDSNITELRLPEFNERRRDVLAAGRGEEQHVPVGKKSCWGMDRRLAEGS